MRVKIGYTRYEKNHENYDDKGHKCEHRNRWKTIKSNKKCLIYFNTRYYYSNIKNIALVNIYSYRYNTNNIHPYRDFIFNK